MSVDKTVCIGIDLGTSGCRAVAISAVGETLAESSALLPPSHRDGVSVQQSPEHWWQAVQQVLPQLLAQIDSEHVRTIAVDGTSGSVLLTDTAGTALTPALMYNDNRAISQAERIKSVAPRNSAAHGTGSGLAKLLWLLEHYPLPESRLVHTQASWISGNLCDRYDFCDANNALKLGYDPVNHCWPDWLGQLNLAEGIFPAIVTPGQPIAHLNHQLADSWGLSRDVMICGGTTDSTAAFIASGAYKPGEAVTSLGSTLVLKVVAEQPVFAPEYGVYSQPLGDYWLVGGGSNSGGAVLRHYFSDQQMAALTPELQPENPTGLHYYPLLGIGERFPVNDPNLPPCLLPQPDDQRRFFQALLEGIAAIEKAGYERLADLGAPYPVSVRSNGGGAKNPAWTAIRARLLGVPMIKATAEEACYGSAQLAARCLGC